MSIKSPLSVAGLLPLLLAACASAAPSNPVMPLPIGKVQGHGMQSPLLGQEVTVQGVITADFSARHGLFVLQDAGDGDSATSDALFLRDAPASLRPGQSIRVRGEVLEIDNQNGSRITALRVLQSRPAPPQPLPASRPLARVPVTVGEWEAIEAMRVQVPVPLTLSGHNRASRHGEWQASFEGRLWVPTEVARPGQAAADVARRNQARTLWLELGSAGRRDIPRLGSQLHAIAGIADERQGQYRLQLAGRPHIEAPALPPPPPRQGQVRVASFNLQNLFNGDGKGQGFPTARGARSAEEYRQQQARLVAALAALDADALALMEMENDGQDAHSAEAQLLLALNAVHGGDWRAVPVPDNANQDAIRNAIFYRQSRLQLQGQSRVLDSGPFRFRNRPALAAHFAAGTGPGFVLVANHFKSKGCGNAKEDDADRGDGQGCWNATRLDSAQRLHQWVGTQFPRLPVVLMGDFNAYAEEDPPHWLRANGWLDAFAKAGISAPYSYVYQGQAGRLDHAFINPALARALRTAHVWHINADEAGSDGDSPRRSSDHDPLLLDFDLRPAPMPPKMRR